MNRKRNNRKRRQRTQVGVARVRQTNLPSPFNRNPGDAMTLHGRGVLELRTNSATTLSSSFMFDPTNRAWQTLQTITPNISGLAALYEQFTVSNVTVRLVPSIPLTAGSYIAVGYEPLLSAGEVSNPGSLNNVCVSKHHVIASPGQTKTMSFQPCVYRNEWNTVAAPEGVKWATCGFLQMYSPYSAPEGTVIGLLDISYDITFCGLHLE